MLPNSNSKFFDNHSEKQLKQTPSDDELLEYQFSLPATASMAPELRAEVMYNLEQNGLIKEATKIRNCLKYIGRYKCQCGESRAAVTHRCRNRLCPDCARLRAEILEREFTYLFRESKSPKMVTLTKKNTADLTHFTYKKIRNEFNKLRKQIHKEGIEVRGGIYALETTYNSKSKTWHVHIHALMDMQYMEVHKLSNMWRDITNGEGFVVHITKANKKARKEVLKYSVKFQKGLPYSEYYLASKDIRLVQAFGNWLKRNPKENDCNKKCHDCPNLRCKEREIEEKAASGDENKNWEREFHIASFFERSGSKSILGYHEQQVCPKCNGQMWLKFDDWESEKNYYYWYSNGY